MEDNMKIDAHLLDTNGYLTNEDLKNRLTGYLTKEDLKNRLTIETSIETTTEYGVFINDNAVNIGVTIVTKLLFDGEVISISEVYDQFDRGDK